MVGFDCNHCKREIDIDSWELYELYDADDATLDCPYCEKEIHVSVHRTFRFTVTDKDGDEID